MTKQNRERDDGQVRDLLTEAGPRPEVPAADLEAIKAASRREWRQRYGPAETPKIRSLEAARHDRRAKVDRPGQRRLTGWGRFSPWLAAASVLLALGLGSLGWWFWIGARPVVGEVVVAQGAVVDGEGRSLALGEPLRAGTVVRSGAGGGVTLRFGEGRSLRLDASSEVRLLSRRAVALEEGAVYIDSKAQPGAAVRTPLGTFQEIGTQFEVRLLPEEGDGERVRLRVREGVVEVRPGTDGAVRTVERGQELRLLADGFVERDTVALHGAPWEWAVAGAPPFPFEEAPLEAFLDWFARETGLQPDFLAESALLTTTVSGDFSGLSVEATLAAALASSGLSYRIEGERLVIDEASEFPADPEGGEEAGP